MVSAPARADFLNTHQDYKGLPVVPAALNIRLRVRGRVSGGDLIRVRSLNLLREGEPYEDEFRLGEISYEERGWFGNYIRAVVNVLRKYGYEGKMKGVELEIDSEIPMGAGLGSSGALEVAVTKFFGTAFNLGLNVRKVAELSYIAEREELGIPCGRLDQYGSAFGGIIKLETRPPFRVERLRKEDFVFVVVNSGIKHSTAEIHPKRQREIDEGLRQLLEQKLPPRLRDLIRPRHFEVKWEEIREEDLLPYIPSIDDVPAKRILFTIRMQRSTELALKILRNERVSRKEVMRSTGFTEEYLDRKLSLGREDLALLGIVMDYQHTLLRDLYEVSLPEIEKIRDAMLDAGAYGAKISGAGMGGAVIAITDNEERGKEILRAGIDAGGVEGWVSRIGEGVRVENA